MALRLGPEKALIFRITHRDNLPFILQYGMHAQNGEQFDTSYREIGKPDLIDKRSRRAVPIAPGGTLSDYVPFYFTPFSMMMFNIKTGYGGVQQVPDDEILILVSSLRHLEQQGVPFVFTNQHAYRPMAEFFSDLTQLDRIDWDILQRRDFKHDPDNDPGKTDRYQAEALVWRHVPLDSLLGICCREQVMREQVQRDLDHRGLTMRAFARPEWYFR